jgi:predicted transposase/invertase (TIGR01784 family)
MVTTRQEKYLNPYTDFGFKRLFGTEANKELLIGFLNQLINDQGIITDVKYLSSEQLGRNDFERRAIFDIYCKTDSGATFIVEMQKAKQNYFKDRSIFYSTFPIQAQAESGEWDYKLNFVYFVGILDFVFDEDKEDEQFYHHDVKLFNLTTKKVFFEKLTYIYLEMPKFKKKEAELETLFDKWLYALKFLPKFQGRPQVLKEQIFERLFHIAEIAKFTNEESLSYEASLKVYRDNYAVLQTALQEREKTGFDKGMKKGKKEGLKEGKKEGKKEGLAEGRAEIVLKMWQKLQSVEDIHALTDIPMTTIAEILKQNGINT